MSLSFNKKLNASIKQKRSNLCIGLDIDSDRMPNTADKTLPGLKSYLKDIIDSTTDISCAYKLNMAFYERYGSEGYKLMEDIVSYIDSRNITIADGKRGDIGNTTNKYAISIFNIIGFDSITVSPYMGSDSILPFIDNKENGVFILCLTSNKSSADIQMIKEKDIYVYDKVSHLANNLNSNDNIGLVIGATKAESMNRIRKQNSLPWLIPGIGAQGGDLEESVKISNSNDSDGLINVSRGIIFAGDCKIEEVRKAAVSYNENINRYK